MKVKETTLELNSIYTVKGFSFYTSKQLTFKAGVDKIYTIFKMVHHAGVEKLIRDGYMAVEEEIFGYFFLEKDDDILDPNAFYITNIEV